jgi:peroxiredoxin
MNEPVAFSLPPDLPKPVDDGACLHLSGRAMPRLTLDATDGRRIDLSALAAPRTVLYCYPMTGVPGTALPGGWDSIPGARGCTPESCAFRDHYREIRERRAEIFGVSAQTTAYQREMAHRLHLPFAVLSDSDFALTHALRLPTFVAAGQRLIKRLTLVVRDGVIEHVFYPVFPPDGHAGQVIDWLDRHPAPERP